MYEKYDIANIHGKVININGVTIAGIGGIFKHKNSSVYALYTHEENLDIAKHMKEADILISHDRPYLKTFDYAHDGLKEITTYLYKNHVSLSIHVHLHEESEEVLKNGTKVICLYNCKLLEL